MTDARPFLSASFPRAAGWRDVLVIGGGASGVLFAANLLRQDTNLRVTVIEGRHLLGCGIAYSTPDPDHLLNTRSHNMTAFPGDDGHFLRWLREQGGTHDHDSFVSRATYGNYLSCLLTPWLDSGRLLVRTAICIAVEQRASGVKATLASGEVLTGAYAVLATGHVLPTPDPSGLITAAWAPAAPPAADAPVLIIGTGLSMVDQLLSLDRAGHHGPVIAISRRGLLPRSHAHGTPQKLAEDDLPLGQPVSRILFWLRARVTSAAAAGGNWRDVLDGIRPFVTAFWQAMSLDQRRRFLRHAAPWWEVHRHRIPPASAGRIAAALASGRLTILRAAFLRAEPGGPVGIRAILRPRDGAADLGLEVGQIIDCRGIRNDPEHHATPIIAGLLAGGAARVDPLRIGLEVTLDCQLIARDGTVSDRIFALGPVSRATFWEITAIPDIRVQAGRMAAFIAAREQAAGQSRAGSA